MDPWGTSVLPGYSCDDFPSRTTRSSLVLRKDEIRQNIWPEIRQDVALWSRPVCQTLSKILDISSAKARVAPELLKALAILSDTTVRRSAVDREDLKLYWNHKKGDFSRGSTVQFFTSLSNPALTTERRLTR